MAFDPDSLRALVGERSFERGAGHAAEGLFCKHCVAVGLVASEGVAAAAGVHRRRAADDVRVYHIAV